MPDLSDEQIQSIQNEVAARRLIEATRLYRQYTGVGLAEAKQAVEQMAAGRTPQIADSASGLSDEQLQAILSELRARKTIPAIKLYREWTGSTLAEAKTVVEQLAASNGIVIAKSGCGTTIFLGLVISLASYFLASLIHRSL
jgi:ribosomal protein L7/L12